MYNRQLPVAPVPKERYPIPTITALTLAAGLALHLTPVQVNKFLHDDVKTYIYARCREAYPEQKSFNKAQVYGRLVTLKAKKYGLEPKFFASVIWTESKFNPREVSSAGALGLGQVMPIWFDTQRIPRDWGFNPEVNLDLSAKILAGYRTRMAKKYPGLPESSLNHRTLVSYNMGPGGVSRGIYRSRYSRKVMSEYHWDPTP